MNSGTATAPKPPTATSSSTPTTTNPKFTEQKGDLSQKGDPSSPKTTANKADQVSARKALFEQHKKLREDNCKNLLNVTLNSNLTDPKIAEAALALIKSINPELISEEQEAKKAELEQQNNSLIDAYKELYDATFKSNSSVSPEIVKSVENVLLLSSPNVLPKESGELEKIRAQLEQKRKNLEGAIKQLYDVTFSKDFLSNPDIKKNSIAVIELTFPDILKTCENISSEELLEDISDLHPKFEDLRKFIETYKYLNEKLTCFKENFIELSKEVHALRQRCEKEKHNSTTTYNNLTGNGHVYSRADKTLENRAQEDLDLSKSLHHQGLGAYFYPQGLDPFSNREGSEKPTLSERYHYYIGFAQAIFEMRAELLKTWKLWTGKDLKDKSVQNNENITFELSKRTNASIPRCQQHIDTEIKLQQECLDLDNEFDKIWKILTEIPEVSYFSVFSTPLSFLDEAEFSLNYLWARCLDTKFESSKVSKSITMGFTPKNVISWTTIYGPEEKTFKKVS